MRISITGASGFIGRNLRLRLKERGLDDVRCIDHNLSGEALQSALVGTDALVHLAGVNRPQSPDEFVSGNADFTRHLCSALVKVAPRADIIFTSSAQAALDSDYGGSKREAENILVDHGHDSEVTVTLLRLTNVFGKWSRPNYNSAIATFCYNIAHDMPITVNDPDAPLKLVYVDDVVEYLIGWIENPDRPCGFEEVGPVYDTTVGAVADTIRGFRESRTSLLSPRVGTGLTRALYSTYVASFTPEQFVYDIPMHGDPRGTFSEMLKTPDCGQFSYFTAHPGITRGEHYHHSKTEKFLVIKGKAEFGFRHVETDERHSIVTSGEKAQIVETAPGWAHNITNVGDDEMIVMLWANEIFDRDKPDTISMKVSA
jgi:UDP-2-acetamido-2,6-beta-L-arabino-hexul-4-ose reductase